MSIILLLACSAFVLSPVSYAEKKINASQPITLTISPKIWNLLETRGGFINKAVTSITFPAFSGRQCVAAYRIWNGKVNRFFVPKSGVSFQNMNNGIHLKVRNVQFGARTNGRVDVVLLGRMNGQIKARANVANLDIKLKWNDFKFVPTVRMNSNVRIEFTNTLKRLDFLRSKLQNMITSKVNREVPRMIVALVRNEVNPRLQKLKQKLISMGYKNCSIEWTTQKNTLRVTFKPKSTKGTVAPVTPIDNMVCVNACVEVGKEVAPTTPKPAPAQKGIDVNCVNQKFKCQKGNCTACTDIDITYLSQGCTVKNQKCWQNFPF